MPDGIFKRWKEGIKNLSPQRQLEATIAFAWGNLIGFFGGFITMLIWVFMARQYQYWWTVFILAICFGATIVDLISKYQQKKAMLKQDEQMNQINAARL